MLFLGLLAFFQTTFLPGYICLRALRIQTDNALQKSVYIFALTLLTNYFLVIALQRCGVYNAPVLYGLQLVEWSALLLLVRTQGKNSQEQPTRATVSSTRFPRPVQVFALASVLIFGWLFITNIGTVFSLWDDFVSWDPWAVELASGRLPASGMYPLLIPANWSIFYVMMQNTDIKLFAKALMPLFPLATLLLFWAASKRRPQELRWLLAIPLYTLILQYFCDIKFICSGFVDIATTFFCALSVYSVLETDPNEPLSARRLLPLVLASAAALTKQAGLYFLVWVIGWQIFTLVKYRPSDWRKQALFSLVLVVALNYWYIGLPLNLPGCATLSNLGYLTQDLHEGRSYPQRFQHAILLIQGMHAAAARPVFWFGMLLCAFSVCIRGARLVFLTVTVPFFLIWAFFFSYDARGLTMALPFAAYGAASSLEQLFATAKAAIQAASKRAEGFTLNTLAALLVVACCVGVLAVGFATLSPTRSLKSAISLFRHADFIREFWPIWAWSLAGATALVALPRLQPRLGLQGVAALALAVAAVALVSEHTWCTDHALLAQQHAAQRCVGFGDTNEQLYALLDKGLIKDKVTTDYLPMKYLPELKTHFQYEDLSQPISPDRLESIRKKRNCDLLLARAVCLPPETIKYLEEHGYKTLVERGWYRLIEFPPTAIGTKQAAKDI